MKLILDKFPNLNIIYRSPFLNYSDGRFSFDRVIMNQYGEQEVKENTFFILNSRKNHWILMTNFKCEPNVWHVYDSLFNDSYLKSTNIFLNSLHEIESKFDFYIVTHRDVQRQKGPNDCGLFCLANLFSLCNGIDPSQLGYKQKEMRAHYNKCLHSKNFEAFPSTSLMRKNIIDNIYIYDCKTKVFMRK